MIHLGTLLAMLCCAKPRFASKRLCVRPTYWHVLAPEHATNSDSLMKMADLALYRAKSAGRNGYRFFDPEMSLAASARHELETELRHAIQQGELELFYQPIIET